MDTLVNTVKEWADFLILGALGIFVLAVPFSQYQPLKKAWQGIWQICYLTEQTTPRDKFAEVIRICLVGGVLFTLFYSAGYAVSGYGRYILQSAHERIIADTAHEVTRLQKSGSDELFGQSPATTMPQTSRKDLWLRVASRWIFRPDVADQQERASYIRDGILQTHWTTCDKTSFEDVIGKSVLAQLHLIRGFIGISFLVFYFALVSVCYSLCPVCTLTRWALSSKQRHKQFKIAVGAIALAFAFQILAGIGIYEDAEREVHATIWSAFRNPGAMQAAIPCTPGDFDDAIRNGHLVKDKKADTK